MVNEEEIEQRNAELKDFKRQRGGIKRQLTNLEQTLSAVTSETDLETLDLELRLTKHLESWNLFDDIQTKIESLSAPEDEKTNEGERTSFETRYYKASGLLKKYNKVLEKQEREFIRTLNSQGSSTIESGASETVPSETGAIPQQFKNFQLPKLQAPEFRGTFDTWLSFHDAFKSMCHENPTIPEIQKFMYLKACLKDEAAEVIASLETTSENYKVAWELLKTRFDNRKYIVDTHVKALFNLPLVSKENPIRSLLDNVQKRVRALKALEQPVEQWDTLLIFLIREKLSNYLREKWEESVGTSNVPSFKDMISFLERRALLEDTQFSYKQNNPLKPNSVKTKPQNLESNKISKLSSTCMSTTVTTPQTKWQPKCPVCSEKHFLNTCNKFLSLSPHERYEELKKCRICHNCFYDNHRTSDCRRSGCQKCHKKHHALLHFDRQITESSNSNSENSSADSSEISTQFVSARQFPARVILGTAILKIADSKGQFHTCRALLDSCSQCNSITRKFSDRLGLPKKGINVKLKGVENLETKIQFSTVTRIQSRTSDIELDISFLVFQEISSQMPLLPLNQNAFEIPKGIVLADPKFYEPAEIDILLGAEHFYDLLGAGQIRMKGQSAILQESALGWIIAGRYSEPLSGKTKQVSCNLMKFQDLPILWDLGQEKSSKFPSEEEIECESHYVKNTVRNDMGDYRVALPFNENKLSLGYSFNNAMQRFHSIERKLDKNPELKSEYDKCIQGYLDEGHMTLIADDNPDSKHGYYLPHHAVVKSDSITTKTRVVFDGSAKTTSGLSLNDALMVGATIQEDLLSIILRFRTYQFAITADIEQMYRQVKVDSESKLFQKILWRFSRDEPIKFYSLNTVTFGTACAPFLAIRTLHQLADDEKDSYPIAAAIVKQDFYVDDVLTGSQTLKDALELKNDLIELLKKGGFNLRKWASNHENLRTSITNENSNSFLSLDPTQTIKTLGLQWNSITDSFSYTINLSKSKGAVTKRKIVSESASVYDPLGLLGPVVVSAKLIIQQLWKSSLGWDDPVPLTVESTWNLYKENLKSINDHNFNRCITIPEFVDIQLHGFCDASERAYGACLYIRSTDKDGKNFSSLLCSKSRVAPLKTTTLPRLELCAASLLVKLYKAADSALHLNIKKVLFWSDSTIVINWINTPPNMLKCFVANRISKIQTSTQPSQWRHVPTKDNPADSLSRGQPAQDFIQNKLWHFGPTWLTENQANWPNLEIKTKEIPEKRATQPIISLKMTQVDFKLVKKCDSLTDLEGERGYLEGLASRYADLFRTHYGDVLEPLEELRRRETNASPRMPNTQLTTSHSQPIYVPGKYSPSSCLSDKEEDEIYGFGYGVFGRQMLQQRQQKLALSTQNSTSTTATHQPTYQSCLSPRSAFFYEFPPNEQGQNTSKKKTTFSRLLRGLKTHKKEKQGHTQSSPKHNRARMGVPQRVDTPDSVLQSGLGLGPDMGHTILRSMVDPRDYDRLRYFQMNGGQSNSFEETIQRLKVQEALKQKERFHKEHEDILRDIRQGLMQLGRDGRGQLPGDDTYMYDDDARCGIAGGLGPGPGGQHWYDEPPYESDPEDFLMGASGGPVPTTTIQNGKVWFTLNLRPENRGERVISLPTAGDISLPRDRSRKSGDRSRKAVASSTMRGLIVSQGLNNPPAIIPLTRASRESGDYASSDVQSRSSGEEGLSPSQSSDYEDQEELESQHCAAIHTSINSFQSEASALLDGDGKSGIAGQARYLRKDVQKKISRLRQDRASSEAFPCSASSVESLPSGSGSSTQALVRAGSNHSSISCEDREAISPTSIGPVLCRARALVDYTPSPYDKDALKFKKGDVIDVVQMNKSGLWKGVVHNRIGHFKFINVEILNERVLRRGEPERGKWSQRYRQKPGSVQELLQRMNLQEHIPVFVLNGYEDLELFRELEPADLDYLCIHQQEHRAKILTAVQLLHDLQSGSEGDLASSSEGDEVGRLAPTSGQTSGHCSPFNRRQFPRDSGCYDAHKNPTRRTVSPETSKVSRENNLDISVQGKCAGTDGMPLSEPKDDFHQNIPISGTIQKEQPFEKSPLLRGGNVRFIAKRGNFGETVVIEDPCENAHKLGMVKYVVGGNSDLGLGCESGSATVSLSQRGCLSEKSSDSGVSSSSLSSAPPPRDKNLVATAASDSPTKNFGNFSRSSPTSQATTAKSQNNNASFQ